MKKYLLTMAILMVLLLGCTKKADQTEDGRMIITMLGRSDAGEDSTAAVKYVNDTIGKEHGFEIRLNGTDQNDSEKLPLLFSSGDIPDIMLLRNSSDPAVSHYEDGLIRSIPKSFIKEYMPNYQRLLDENPMGKLMLKSPDNEEEVLGILNFAEMYEVPLYVVSIRDDWAKAAGYDFGDLETDGIALDPRKKVYILPDKMIITLEELEGLMAAIKEGITVDGEEIKAIPLGAYDTALDESYGPIMGAFGVNPRGIYQVDGKLMDAKIMPGYREFLSTISDWYNKGYIDPEFLSTNRTQYWDKMTAKITGIGVGGLEWIGADWAKNRPPNILAQDDSPHSRSLVFPLVQGADGTMGGQIFNGSGPFNVDNSVIVRHDVSDEKLINILRTIDYIKIGNYGQKGKDEHWLVGQYGLPGIHFDWEGEAYNSYPVIRGYDKVPEGNLKMGRWPLHFPQIYTVERQKYMLPGALNEWWSKYWANSEGTGLGQRYGSRGYRFDINEETRLPEIRKRVSETLGTLTNEFFVNTLMGKIDINDDAVWNDYVQKWLEYGGQELLNETAKAPILEELLKGNIVY